MSGQQVRRLKPEDPIFAEGDVGDCAYLIEHGRVLIYIHKDDVEVPLRVIGPGEVFGEMSLIDASPRSASCRALSDCRLIVVTKDQLLCRIHSADPIVRLLMQVLLERLRSQNDRIRGKTPSMVPVDMTIDPLAHEKKAALERIGLENRIAQGLENDEFVPYYQPIYDLWTGELKGCEALIRWISKDNGVIPPSMFMDAMEETSLILRGGQVVIEKSLADLPAFVSQFTAVPHFFVSINVSGRQFGDPTFLEHLEANRIKFGLLAGQIKLELTERIMTEGPQALTALHECRKLGYRLAIDDFGTGFSSLQYLAQMPLTDLKIDRSFVNTAMSDQKTLLIVKSLIYMAEGLGLNMIAEGIETPEQLALLRSLKVDMAQGFLFSKPLPLVDFLKLADRFSVNPTNLKAA